MTCNYAAGALLLLVGFGILLSLGILAYIGAKAAKR